MLLITLNQTGSTFDRPFGSGRRDDQCAASSFLQAEPFVQPGHAEGGGVLIGRTGATAGAPVAAPAAVALDLEDAQLLVGEVGADLAEVGHDDEPVGDGQEDQVGRLQQARDAESLETVKGLEKKRAVLVRKSEQS